MMRRMSAALERMTVSGPDYASRGLWCRGKPVSAQNRHDRHASARKRSWVDCVIAPQYLQVLVAVTDGVAINQHHLALEITPLSLAGELASERARRFGHGGHPGTPRHR